jgi:lysophospholipase L1-like esterase
VLAATLLSCGGGGSPDSPSSPPPPPGSPADVVVFYDENANGLLDRGENIRVPDVDVVIGSRTARTSTGGAVTVAGVPTGSYQVTVRAETLPPFFQPGAPVSVSVPVTSNVPVEVPLVLPIGREMHPNLYMAFGDSITRGDGATPAQSYPSRLQQRLAAHFGGALVNNRGADATNTFEALERFRRNFEGIAPAYTLILYGTNDWHDPVCQDTPPCHTVNNLRTVVRGVKAGGSLPFIGTLIPVNPALNGQGRNDWIDAVNAQIKAMAREEGAFLVDLNQAFKNEPNLVALFDDGVHPNAAGYDVMSRAWFEAIAHGRSVP